MKRTKVLIAVALMAVAGGVHGAATTSDCCASGMASGVLREQAVAVEGLAASLASGGELSLPAFDGRPSFSTRAQRWRIP